MHKTGYMKVAWRIIPLCLILMFSSWVSGQEASNRLTSGQPVNSTIDADNAAQVFTFQASANDTASFILTPQTSLALTLLVTDAQGTQLGQVIGTGSEVELTLDDIALAAAGSYYVVVFPTAASDAPSTGEFILTLNLTTVEAPEATEEASITETPPPTTVDTTFQPGQQVVLNSGIRVDLSWATADDLNLQVRAPNGGTLFWDSRLTDDGGTFGLDANGLCEVVTDPAVETASWPGGAVAAGSYEVLVYYRQACSGGSPVDFTLNITVDGESLPAVQAQILPPTGDEANVYISSFTVTTDGQAVEGVSGPYLDTRTLDVAITDLLSAEAVTVGLDQPATGLITNQQPYQTFKFEGLAGQLVSINLTATTGNLDTLLLVLDSTGTIIGANDDIIAAEDTNSGIRGLRLPTEDVYTIVATRYGKSVGGTEGDFALVVSGSDIPVELLNLQLPTGDIEITLTWETNADLQLLVRDPSGDSVYDDVTSVASGGRITEQGNINCTLTDSNPVSYIYWPEDFLRIGSYEVEVWHQSECNDSQPATFTIYVVVQGSLVFTDTVTIQFNEKYLTSFTIDQSENAFPSVGGIIGGSDTLNWQGDLASAVLISPDQVVPGSITADEKFDLYAFEALAGDVITIDLRATSDTLDTLLFLIDPNGVEIASNDDSNESTSSLISNTLLSQDGRYLIIATHYGAAYGGTIGGYNLSLRIDR